MSERKVYCPFLIMANVEVTECMLDSCAIFNRIIRMCGLAFIPKDKEHDKSFDKDKLKLLYPSSNRKVIKNG